MGYVNCTAMPVRFTYLGVLERFMTAGKRRFYGLWSSLNFAYPICRAEARTRMCLAEVADH